MPGEGNQEMNLRYFKPPTVTDFYGELYACPEYEAQETDTHEEALAKLQRKLNLLNNIWTWIQMPQFKVVQQFLGDYVRSLQAEASKVYLAGDEAKHLAMVIQDVGITGFFDALESTPDKMKEVQQEIKVLRAHEETTSPGAQDLQ
jgi:hypothetical protein